MMITPAILLSTARCCRVACPIELATAPNTMNTRLNPRMNITEFSITERISLPSCWRSSSTPAPEISDTYPGTSGSTHGDRNEINPATNAAIGKGNDDIASSSNFPITRLPDFNALAQSTPPRSRWSSPDSADHTSPTYADLPGRCAGQ